MYSRTSTVCLLVDTTTGTQEEPDRRGEKKRGGMQYHLSFIRGQGELAKVLNVARQLQEENA